jgi:RNA polymerase sigma factor (sigma-70 family)
MKKNLLSNKQIIKLLESYHYTGDINTRNYVVEKCLYLCPGIAEKYSRRYPISYEDALSYAQEGLILAAEQFNCNPKASFYAYAPNIIVNAVLRGIYRVNGIATNYIYEFYNNYEQISRDNDLADDVILKKTIELLQEERGMSDFSVNRATNAYRINNPISYSSLIDDINSKEELIDAIELEDAEFDSPEYTKDELNYLSDYFINAVEEGDKEFAYTLGNEIKSILDKMISNMKANHRDIIERHYGLNNRPQESYREISKKDNVTHSNVCSVEKTALKKVRIGKDFRRLRELLPFTYQSVYSENKSIQTIDDKSKKTR